MFGTAQLAVDTTLVFPVSADGQPRRRCAEHDGAALGQARQAKVSLCCLLRLVEVVNFVSHSKIRLSLESSAKACAMPTTTVVLDVGLCCMM